MESHLRDRDIISLLLEEVDEDPEDDIVFNSSDEESHEVTEENREIDMAALEEDVADENLEVVADENSSDSEMDVPLSELTSQPSGRIYKGKDGTLWHKIPLDHAIFQCENCFGNKAREDDVGNEED